MAFLDSLARYQALAFGGTPAAAAAAGKAASGADVTEQKLILLRQLYAAIDDAYQSGDTAALRVYQAQMDAYTDLAAQRGRLMQTLIQNEGRMSVAQMQAAAADIRNIRDNYARMLAGNEARARAAMSRIEAGIAARDPALARDQAPAYRAAVVAAQAASLDPKDPASWLVYQDYQRRFPAETAAAFPAAWVSEAQAANASQQAQLASLNNAASGAAGGRLDTTGLIRTLQQLDTLSGPQPTMESARAQTLSPERQARIAQLEQQVGALEEQVGGVAKAGTTAPGVGGLTQAEAEGMLTDPRFRAWAESRGYKLGEVRDTGYVMGPQDIAALRAASREASTGRPALLRGGALPGDEVAFQAATTRPADAPQVVLGKLDSTGQYLASGYIVYPDGRVDVADFANGDSSPLRLADGSWAPTVTPDQAKAYNDARAANGASTLLHPETKRPLTYTEMVARIGSGGLDLDAVETSETPPAGATAFEDVRGRVMPPRLGDDPAVTRRILTPDGTTIATYTKGEDGNWTRTGTEEYAYRGIHRPQADAMPDRTTLRRPPLDRYYTPPGPVMDEVFMGEVAGEKVGRIARAAAGEPAAPAIPATVYPAGAAITDPVQVGSAMERRADQADALRAGLAGAAAQARAAVPTSAAPTAPERERGRVLEALRAARQRRQDARQGAREHETETMPGPGAVPPVAPPVPAAEPLSAEELEAQENAALRRQAVARAEAADRAAVVEAARQDMADTLATLRQVRAPVPVPQMPATTRPPTPTPSPVVPGTPTTPPALPAAQAAQVTMPAGSPPDQAARRLATLLARPAGAAPRGVPPAPPAPPEPEPDAERMSLYDARSGRSVAVPPMPAPEAPPPLGLRTPSTPSGMSYPPGTQVGYSTPGKATATALRKLIAAKGM